MYSSPFNMSKPFSLTLHLLPLLCCDHLLFHLDKALAQLLSLFVYIISLPLVTSLRTYGQTLRTKTAGISFILASTTLLISSCPSPEHLPVFCLSSVPPFCFLPILLSVVELQPLSCCHFQLSSGGRCFPSVRSFHVCICFAATAALIWSVREPGSKSTFHYLSFISLKAERNSLEDLLKRAALQICTRDPKSPLDKASSDLRGRASSTTWLYTCSQTLQV